MNRWIMVIYVSDCPISRSCRNCLDRFGIQDFAQGFFNKVFHSNRPRNKTGQLLFLWFFGVTNFSLGVGGVVIVVVTIRNQATQCGFGFVHSLGYVVDGITHDTLGSRGNHSDLVDDSRLNLR